MAKNKQRAIARQRNAPIPIFTCMRDVFAWHARTAPNRFAILSPGHAPITYGQLWIRVREVNRELRRLGVSPTDRVAVVLPAGAEAAVAIVAVAASAVCLPLNPGFMPAEWRRYFADLKVSCLLSRPEIDSASRTVANTVGLPIIDLVSRTGKELGAFTLLGLTSEPEESGEPSFSTADAFMLMTSGTSSRPKIVPLSQASVCLSARNVGATLELNSTDRLLSVLPFFHVHGLVSGLLAALVAGSSVVCTPGFDAESFLHWLQEFSPTWYTAVPAIHQAVLSAARYADRTKINCSLRVIRSASSTLQPSVTAQLEKLFSAPVIDTYGMTEAASQIAANPLRRRKAGSVGKPAGVEVSILDKNGRQLPAGRRGEIVLRGPTITRGYDNDLAVTNFAFRDDWFRTGDLGYLDRDGYLFVVGRIKDIINRGGQKIAPAEVEQALLKHPDVIEAAAFSIEHPRLGEDVAAAVVLRPGANTDVQAIQDVAREHLASFKVPGSIRVVPEIPKGPAGKIRRNDLAAALSMMQRPTQEAVTLPRTELERQLTTLWEELLEVDRVGVADDVFARGADSITVTRILFRLRSLFGVDFSLKDVFDAPTIEKLAARLEALRPELTAAAPKLNDSRFRRAERNEHQMPSLLQENVLRMLRERPELPQFNMVYAYRLVGPLNVPALDKSLTEVIRRHESLRTRFSCAHDRPVALVTSPDKIESVLAIERLASKKSKGRRAQQLLLKKAELITEQHALWPFDLGCAPLLRARLLHLGSDDHVLVLILHEIITDGWSMGIFMEELSALYFSFASSTKGRLPEQLHQFSCFALWQRRWSQSEAAHRQLAYWKKHLDSASPVFATNADVKGAFLNPNDDQEPLHVTKDLAARLIALGKAQRATLFMTLLTALKAQLLSRTGRGDLCVATAMANRSQTMSQHVVGPVANTVLIRTHLDADLPFTEALARVRTSVLEAYQAQDLPFDIVAARLKNDKGVDATSLLQVFFVLQNAFRQPLKLPDVTVQPFAFREGQPVMPIDCSWLTLTLRETPMGINGACRYKMNLFEPPAVKHMMADYGAILAKIVAKPEEPLGRLFEDLGQRDSAKWT